MAQADSRRGNWQFILDDVLTCSRHNGQLKMFGTMKLMSTVADSFLTKSCLDYFTEQCQEFYRKDVTRATGYKEKGNKLFVAQIHQEALQAYTLSMQFSPSKKPQADNSGYELGVAYGNRSAVLFRLHKYQECLTDIERALAAGVADRCKPKFMVRRCLCHARLGQKDKAVAVQQSIVSLQQTCDHETARYFEAEMIKIKAQIESIGGEPGAQSVLEEASVSYGENSVLVQASSAVEMKSTPTQGRFLQATRDIKAGDTLIVERPFAAVLLPPHYHTRCQHCFVELPLHPVGCAKCSAVLYCGEQCRDVSWDTYHYVECRYTHLLHSVGIAHLSMRIILTVGLSELEGFLAERRERAEGGGSEVVPGVTEEGRYERNYLSVYDLVTHTGDMVTDDLFQYTLTAHLLLAMLIHSGWLSHPQPRDPKRKRSARMKDALHFLDGSLGLQRGDAGDSGLGLLCARRMFSVGGALSRHVQQLVCNAHAITGLHYTQVSQHHLVETQSQQRVATAIYPTASLMNHACHPTIASSFDRDVLVVVSVMDVEKGGEIFNCYGPSSLRMARQERQEVLKTQYFFDCHCHACSTDGDSPQGVLCGQCGDSVVPDREVTVCPACGASIDMDSILSQLASADEDFREGATCLEQGDYSRALERLGACVEVRKKVMSPNNHDLGQVHDAMAQCLAITGRYQEAATHLTYSVAVTVAIFGPESLETARELHKMAEVMVQAREPGVALKTVKEALRCASKLCGPRDPWLQEVRCLHTALTSIMSHGDLH